MSKRVLIIETSLRNDSNSDRLAESFAQGARDGGNEVIQGESFCRWCK